MQIRKVSGRPSRLIAYQRSGNSPPQAAASQVLYPGPATDQGRHDESRYGRAENVLQHAVRRRPARKQSRLGQGSRDKYQGRVCHVYEHQETSDRVFDYPRSKW
jgi:hypothetical protein